jgi:lysozyme
MPNAISSGVSTLTLAYDNKAAFTRSKRKGMLVMLDGGLVSKALPSASIGAASHTVAPPTDTFWADRHSPNNTIGGTTNQAPGNSQETSAMKKTHTARSDCHDFWGQRHCGYCGNPREEGTMGKLITSSHRRKKKKKKKKKKKNKENKKNKGTAGKKVAPAFLRGLDVSSFQQIMDWKKVAATGVSFAYIKATEGTTIQDPFFASNRANAKDAGLIVGAYHLFRPKTAGQAQIDNFVSTVGKVESGELPPVLDIEVPEDWTALSVTARIQLVKEWLTAVEAALGVRPIIYINNSDAQTLLNNDPSFDAYELFVAFPTRASAPLFPRPWTNWMLWQHDWQGTVSGISTNCDLDYFQGSLADLKKLLKP